MTETVRHCIHGPHRFEPDHGHDHDHAYRCQTCGLRIAAIVFAWYELGREDERRDANETNAAGEAAEVAARQA